MRQMFFMLPVMCLLLAAGTVLAGPPAQDAPRGLYKNGRTLVKFGRNHHFKLTCIAPRALVFRGSFSLQADTITCRVRSTHAPAEYRHLCKRLRFVYTGGELYLLQEPRMSSVPVRFAPFSPRSSASR